MLKLLWRDEQITDSSYLSSEMTDNNLCYTSDFTMINKLSDVINVMDDYPYIIKL